MGLDRIMRFLFPIKEEFKVGDEVQLREPEELAYPLNESVTRFKQQMGSRTFTIDVVKPAEFDDAAHPQLLKLKYLPYEYSGVYFKKAIISNE